ncbi:ribosomal RNA small subunit methyltransferase A [Pelagibacterales bacterium SAG-MED31]|nr:ribosomal RNA small subunit methyltransferase A [Pelagibacterales bacterium SAG-MED31]
MIKPKKSLGQNFLIDKNIINKIINQTNIFNENIIEIGPGLGNLTDVIISKNPKNLIIIEKDLKLFNYLNNKYKNKKQIKLINADVLNYDFSNIKNGKIISNLPYNISTKIIMKLIFLNKNITEIICMIQKELAEKFDYNNTNMNKYRFILQFCTHYKMLFNVSNKVFYPKPKVNSKVVTFKLKNIIIDQEKLFSFTNQMFRNKRKSLRNKIKKNLLLNEKILCKRVEELSFNELLEIYKTF